MNKLFFLLLLIPVFAYAQIPHIQTADSIRIIGFKYDFELLSPPNREDFIEYVMDMSDSTTDRAGKDTLELSYIIALDHVDTTIVDKQEIEYILSSIDKQIVYKELPYSAMEINKRGYYSKYSNHIVWTPINELDNKLLLLVFRNDDVEFIWLTPGYVDRGYNRYLLSKDVSKALSRYSHVFDAFIRDSD